MDLPLPGSHSADPVAWQVTVGRVRWIAPTGLAGLTPLASVGPLAIGPSAAGLERTSFAAPEVVVSINALQSLLQRKVVLAVEAMDTRVGHNTTLTEPLSGTF